MNDQTIQVEVVQRDAPLVVLQQDVERGAGNLSGNAQTRGHALHKLGFASAQIARKHHHIARMQVRSQRFGQLLRRLRGRGFTCVCQSVSHNAAHHTPMRGNMHPAHENGG